MEMIKLIEEMEDLLDDASSVPFSKKVMIDADEFSKLIKEMRDNLPEEVKQAKWINEERDRILSDAQKMAEDIKISSQKEADIIMIEAQKKFDALINEHDITKQAKKYGAEIVSKEEQKAMTLRMQSITYVDELLGSTQNKLKDMINATQIGRASCRERV